MPGGWAAFWAAFAVGHAWLAWRGVGPEAGAAFYDVELYRFWVATGLLGGPWPVLDTDWVYPVGALLPMLAVAPWAATGPAYALAWAGLVTVLNAVAVGVLARTLPHGLAGAWWWLAATLALGPVAIGRLDGVVAPVTVTALAIAATRPRVAGALLALGAWIKVAPGGALIALALTARRPWRDVLVPAAAVAVVVVAVALAAGAGGRVAGFVVAQGARDLQVESVAATGYSLARLWDPTVWADLNVALNTYEVTGRDTRGIAAWLDVALLVAVAGIAWLTWRARRRGTEAGDLREILLLATFALTLALVAVNKVGSPQFMSWLLPPVAVAVGAVGWSGRWRLPAAVVLAVAALTQWLFPVAYVPFLLASPPIVVAAAVRNAALVVLLGWAVVALVRAGSTRPDPGPAEEIERAGSVAPWPS